MVVEKRGRPPNEQENTNGLTVKPDEKQEREGKKVPGNQLKKKKSSNRSKDGL